MPVTTPAEFLRSASFEVRTLSNFEGTILQLHLENWTEEENEKAVEIINETNNTNIKYLGELSEAPNEIHDEIILEIHDEMILEIHDEILHDKQIQIFVHLEILQSLHHYHDKN